MDPKDIIEIPGYPGLFARRLVVQMWQRAGSPPINDAGRLFATQLSARLKFENGTGSPADDPRRPDLYPLAHVRFAALDVANWARSAMIAAGFEYPYSYEPWHAQLPNIYSYPLVSSIPSTAYASATTFQPASPQEDDMSYPVTINKVHRFHIAPGFIKHFDSVSGSDLTKNIISADDKWIDLDVDTFNKQLDSFGIPRWYVDAANGGVFDVSQGKVVKGGMWSWAREAANTSAVVAKAVAALSVVTPPKA